VASLLRLDYPHFEIVIADNGPSTNATANVVQTGFGHDPRIQYVALPRAGTSQARNRGIELAQGEIIAFCDDDVRHHPRWLMELVRGFEAGPRVACVTGLVLPQELETPPQLWIEQYGGYSKGFAPRIFDLADHMPHDRLFPFTTGRLGTGANMAFRTSILRSIGGFDAALGGGSPAIGGEDLALSFQVIAAGYQLVYQPAAVVYHPHYREYAALRKQMYGYGVGLAAYLTKCVIDHPSLALDILRKFPLGLAYVLSPRSPKNRKKSRTYPRDLTTIELKGMFRGPLAYLRGRCSRSRENTGPAPRVPLTSPAMADQDGIRSSREFIRPGPDV
jgi:GT2 family glycosyltransferase